MSNTALPYRRRRNRYEKPTGRVSFAGCDEFATADTISRNFSSYAAFEFGRCVGWSERWLIHSSVGEAMKIEL